MSSGASREKWDRIYAVATEEEPGPADVLRENAHLLPMGGDALDLACGRGGNALFLARRGFRVCAWDISPVAIGRLAGQAERSGLVMEATVRDVESAPFPRETFNVITVSRFLARPLSGAILDSLSPGGLLFYQTYVREKPNPKGPGNPDYLLGINELLDMFRGLRVLVYREEGRVGDLSAGNRDEASLVGQKR
jgi:tellurite methyltransferase